MVTGNLHHESLYPVAMFFFYLSAARLGLIMQISLLPNHPVGPSHPPLIAPWQVTGVSNVLSDGTSLGSLGLHTFYYF